MKKIKKKKFKCKFCGKEFEDYPTRKRIFCSYQCRQNFGTSVNTGRTRFKKGYKPHNKGKRGVNPGNKTNHYSGEKHWNWQDGKSFESYSLEWTEDLKDSIKKRDNYICQECGIHQDELEGFIKKLDIHHKDYDKNNLNPDNLITLCRSCHIKTNFNRKFWIIHFQYNLEGGKVNKMTNKI